MKNVDAWSALCYAWAEIRPGPRTDQCHCESGCVASNGSHKRIFKIISIDDPADYYNIPSNDRALKRRLFRIFFDSHVQPYELYENNLRRYE